MKCPEKFFVRGTGTETCIMITEGKYFHHGQYRAILNNDGKKRLIKYLPQLSKKNPDLGLTNWQTISSQWNIMNPKQSQTSTNIKDMPDYKKL